MTRAVQWPRPAADDEGLPRPKHSTVEAAREEEENKGRRSRGGSLQGDLGTSKRLGDSWAPTGERRDASER